MEFEGGNQAPWRPGLTSKDAHIVFSRWYTAAVILFWCAAMGWLVKEKILPPLLVGDPPSYRTIFAADESEDDRVGWDIFINDRRLGAATTVITHLPEGINQLGCTLDMWGLPLAELAPAWLTAFVKVLDVQHGELEANIDLHSETTIGVNSLNHPFAFTSNTRFGTSPWRSPSDTGPPAMQLSMSMNGKIEGNEMAVVMRSGSIEYHTKLELPADALIGDVLSPQTRLPGLRVGQTWSVPIYSPFRSPKEPLEVLHATVERKDLISWHDRIIRTLVVIYRGDPGLGLSSNQSPRAQMWVDLQGRVIKQEVSMLSTRLTFVRTELDAEAFTRQVNRDRAISAAAEPEDQQSPTVEPLPTEGAP